MNDITAIRKADEVRYYNGDGNPGQTLAEVADEYAIWEIYQEYLEHTRDVRGMTS